jgi:sulfoxide reductase catalytic subunit YedY
MLIRKSTDVQSSEITPEGVYMNRRAFMTAAGGAAAGILAAGALSTAMACGGDGRSGVANGDVAQGAGEPNPPDKLNSWEQITTYNNYYEFGTDKEDPSDNAGSFRTKPWSITVDGLVKKPGKYALEDFIKGFPVQDRTYRMRCVEAWSMVIPWNGIPLRDIIARLEPLPSAKYVAFQTVYDPQQMPGQRRDVLQWPYVEGLRMDEATNPLTLFATGIYGKPLPNQDGAPIRLVTPWKYGFKGIKAIVKLSFVDRQPPTTWNIAASNEYGFYANVNPTVDHPRWSQASERRIGEFRRRPTLMFNGYGDQVAHMYAGMDLRKNF